MTDPSNIDALYAAQDAANEALIGAGRAMLAARDAAQRAAQAYRDALVEREARFADLEAAARAIDDAEAAAASA